MNELAALYEKIAALGLPFVLFLALVGNRLRVYYWGWRVDELIAEQAREDAECDARAAAQAAAYEQRIARLEARNEKLIEALLESAGVSERAVAALTKRTL